MKLSSTDIFNFSEEIFHNIKLLDIWDKENFHVFLTINAKNEIDTNTLINSLLHKNKNIFISKSNFEDNTLENFEYTKNTKLKTNSWGIPEPKDTRNPINDKDIDVVFVPLLAFDENGHRVGYGKGFYDNFLAKCKPDVIKVGISYFEAEENIEDINQTDIKIDYCITPKKNYYFKK